MQRHHTYSKKFRNKTGGTHEIKIVDGKKHRAWHLLVADLSPKQAIEYIAKNFLPSNIEIQIREL